MPALFEHLVRIVLIGVGATAVMDLWLLLLKRLNVPTLNFALLGRWVGHVLRGKWAHDAIAKAAPLRGELALGWATHYAVGVAFAGVLAVLAGSAWTTQPTLLPALCVGIGSVVAPLFVMQPAMGAGFASSKTPAPLRNCLRSVVNHGVFGTGLYLAASVVTALAR